MMHAVTIRECATRLYEGLLCEELEGWGGGSTIMASLLVWIDGHILPKKQKARARFKDVFLLSLSSFGQKLFFVFAFPAIYFRLKWFSSQAGQAKVIWRKIMTWRFNET